MNKFTALSLVAALCSSATTHATEYLISPVTTLQNLADDAYSERRIGGGFLLASGLGLLLVSSSISDDLADEFDDVDGNQVDTALDIVGGLMLVGGGLALHYQSKTEKAFWRVAQVEDPLEQQELAYSEVFNLASARKTERMMTGITALGAAAYFMTAENPNDDNQYTYNAVMLGASGLANLLVASKPERALKRLDLQRFDLELRDEIDWSVGLDKTATPFVALNYRF